MTKEAVLKICKDLKLYRTPHLNDVLYLHFKGTNWPHSLHHDFSLNKTFFSSRILLHRELGRIHRPQVFVAGEQWNS